MPPPIMATSQLRVIPSGAAGPYADVDESARQEVIVAWPVDERRRLLKAERASLHLRKGESGLAQLVELGKISAGLDDVDLGVCTDLLEADLVNLAEQRPTLGEGQAREGDLGRLGRVRPHRVGVADPHAEIWFLEHQPPAGSQPGDYPSQQVHARGYMHEHRSCMYEIERAGRKRIGTDVVPDDLDVRGVYLTQKPNLQVGTDHAPGRASHIGQPPGDRPSPPPISRHLALLPTPRRWMRRFVSGSRRCSNSSRRPLRPRRNAGTRSPEPHSQPGS